MKSIKQIFTKKGLSAVLIFFTFTAANTATQDFFEDGKKFLAADYPDKAVSLLYQASIQPGAPQDIFLYLGVGYLRMGKYADAIVWLEKGKKNDIINSHLYSYNMGIAFFSQNRLTEAEAAFSQALDSASSYSPAVLNRANTRVNLGNFAGALEDYKKYLVLEQESPCRTQVIKMIAALEQSAAEADNAAIMADTVRLAEEARLASEEARQKKLLEDVNSSLSCVDEANSISSGAENTIDYSEENNLD